MYNTHFVYFLDIRYQTPLLIRSGITGLEVTYAADEKALFQEITNIIKRYYLVFSDFFQSFHDVAGNIGKDRKKEENPFL
jgi:hypothetical protein